MLFIIRQDDVLIFDGQGQTLVVCLRYLHPYLSRSIFTGDYSCLLIAAVTGCVSDRERPGNNRLSVRSLSAPYQTTQLG